MVYKVCELLNQNQYIALEIEYGSYTFTITLGKASHHVQYASQVTSGDHT
jgi:hypothetical protein